MSMPALFKGRLSIPVIGSPLFIISVPDLVIAQCKAGVEGSFPSLNARPPELLDEWLEISGPVIAAWALISWPRLPGLLPPLVQTTNEGVDEMLELKSQALDDIALSIERNWRKALPLELGHDVIAVKSELQYLRVWTNRGAALVLGSLQEVEDEEGSAGMRIHRSWWVHARHVRTVRRRGEAAICELSDGREVPISRRRKADAVARFGDRARYQEMPTASKSLPARDGQNNRRNPT